MRKPRKGDFVEIWEPIPGYTHGLELHLVFVLSASSECRAHFRAVHHNLGGLVSIPLKNINKIIGTIGNGWNEAYTEFMKKTKKESRNVY